MNPVIQVRGKNYVLAKNYCREHQGITVAGMNHQIGSYLGAAAAAVGIAELGRQMVEPVTGPLFAVAPSPDEWEKWMQLINPIIVFAVGTWTMITNKLKAGFRADLEQIKSDLSDIREDSDVRHASLKEKISEIRETQIDIQATVSEHSRVIEAARQRQKEKSKPPEKP